MTDSRYKKLAEVLTGYSTELKKGDTVLFDITDTPEEFAIELVRAARKRGATPLVETRSGRIIREMLFNTDETHAKTCLLYTSPSPRDYAASRMPSSA